MKDLKTIVTLPAYFSEVHIIHQIENIIPGLANKIKDHIERYWQDGTYRKSSQKYKKYNSQFET